MGKRQMWDDDDDVLGGDDDLRRGKKKRNERGTSLRLMEGAEQPMAAFMAGAPFGERRPAPRAFQSGPPVHHDATCATCGAPTTVPFKPFPGRAVYCRGCFHKAG